MSRPLVIIGGGITGLTAAYLAARAGEKVVVLEGSTQVGGLLATFTVKDTRLEHYYHHFFTHDAEIRWLVHELGLDEHLQFNPATMGIFRDGRSYDFNGPKDLLRFAPLSPAAKLRFGATSLYLGKLADWRRHENVPALEWFYRYAGRAATEAVWRPMLEVKFGPFAGQVPVAWMIGRLRQRLGSRERGDERLGYLRGSLKVLLDALLRELSALGVKIVLQARVEKLVIRQDALAAVQTTAGEFEGSRFLATIPTVHLAPLLQEARPDFARRLADIKYFGAVCTILELDRPLSQVYWLNVADAGFPFGGVIEHTNFIPPSVYGGRHIVYLSRYFEADNALARMPEAEIARMMIDPLDRIYPQFDRSHVHKAHVFRTLTAATVCDLQFSKKVPPVVTPLPNLYLATMAHIYPDERSCNNSIRVAANACRLLGIDASVVPAGASLSGQVGMD
ncbi:MAG TPA: NAD(P)/FAD-dependent oxidoreductase [Opitutaceae bacterium]|jgi:protoporphyrinogen oxidase|nr:NAD(P)/FAD-dependent oxidoreductase [Opitutaceae bacterium]